MNPSFDDDDDDDDDDDYDDDEDDDSNGGGDDNDCDDDDGCDDDADVGTDSMILDGNIISSKRWISFSGDLNKIKSFFKGKMNKIMIFSFIIKICTILIPYFIRLKVI